MTELFAGLRTPLLRYLSTLGVSPADGEDIAQETFLSLHRHLLDGKRRDNLRGWVFRVGYNLAMRRLRDGEIVAEPDPDQADPAPNPEETTEFEQRRARLLAVVRALPDLDRRCLMLRVEGLRYRDIAAALDISLGGVSASLARSMDRLANSNERL